MGRLKIVYPVCCGMDVHRDFLIACIAATNAQGVTEYQSRRFSTYTGSLRELRDWLLANDCEELSKSRGRTISFWLNNIPFSASIDTCSFSKTQDNKYYRDFNIIVTNQFFLSPN